MTVSFIRCSDRIFNKMLHVAAGFGDAPGYRTLATIKAGLLGQTGTFGEKPKYLTWKDLVENGNIVAGTPSQVTEQLEFVIRDLRIGHLMMLNQIGSMPHDLAMENIRRTATEVVPKLRHIWEGEWEDHWWIKPVERPREPRGIYEGTPETLQRSVSDPVPSVEPSGG